MFEMYFKSLVVAFGLSAVSTFASAAGMVPETSVVLVNAGDGEGSINVTNSDDQVLLLYSALENLPEDPEELLLITSPISRVEAGEKQLVRFIFQSDTPLTTQRMKRVTFEGIPPMKNDGQAKINITVQQNLPVIVSPADLPLHNEPWTLLKWQVQDQTLTVRNDSRYVVRLNQQLDLMPTGGQLTLPRTYLLPGQSDSLTLPASASISAETKIRLYPASLYGYQGASYDAALNLQ
ncbi:fimbria/pilus chaperone family protein [Pseudomonas sp. MDT1-17]